MPGLLISKSITPVINCIKLQPLINLRLLTSCLLSIMLIIWGFDVHLQNSLKGWCVCVSTWHQLFVCDSLYFSVLITLFLSVSICPVKRVPIQRPSCSTGRMARWNAWSQPTSSSRSSSAWRLRGQRNAGRSWCNKRPCGSRETGCWGRGSRGWSRNGSESNSRIGRPTGGSSCWERSTKGQILNQSWSYLKCSALTLPT